MEAGLLARLGLSRLRIPVPTAKLAIIHSAAEVLNGAEQGVILWDALIEWITGLELESEILEALCIPVLAKSAKHVNVAALLRAISRPSALTDIFIQEISGNSVFIKTWTKCHSGEVPPLFNGDEILEELSHGQMVPRILVTRFRHLENCSGYPFTKQWAFECQRLVDRLGEQSDGHWTYFIQGDRQRATGQFVTRRGHLARSAYLRTLSLAHDCWEMPEEMVYEEAMYATPTDFTFLRMLPGIPPLWNKTTAESMPSSIGEMETLLSGIIQAVIEDGTFPELIHMNVPLGLTETYQAEVELISCLYEGSKPQPEDVFFLHNHLPGRYDDQRRL
jgi:hypothetical protein